MLSKDSINIPAHTIGRPKLKNERGDSQFWIAILGSGTLKILSFEFLEPIC